MSRNEEDQGVLVHDECEFRDDFGLGRLITTRVVTIQNHAYELGLARNQGQAKALAATVVRAREFVQALLPVERKPDGVETAWSMCGRCGSEAKGWRFIAHGNTCPVPEIEQFAAEPLGEWVTKLAEKASERKGQ